ncbi:MAG: LacI family DNA-binding transcriptional regulator [Lachnospiraceae bacterium]|nr:LacI family DNA-binding transcriptional regulator [Lachnospiraceae bacterium]MBR4993721.1 LacI family DNA-binding transcriptional regulator [Lachnospiraceae bacterium]MBR5945413.1 LacI family DNA-binding transcriptional regulator [Lachnospiraceae bacterium]
MTIKDIAKETGYSIGTVSRVLNNHPNVSDKARKIITEAVDRHGFILNVSAKNLKQVQSENIIIIVKGTFNELFPVMVQRIQLYFRETRYTLITEYVDEEADEVTRARELCLEKKAKGLIFLGGNKENFINGFERVKIPTVLATNYAGDWNFENLSSVSTDDVEGARKAVLYLLKEGHRNVAMIGGTEGSDTSMKRQLGWQKAQEDMGIDKKDFGPAEKGRYSFEAGYKAMQKLLKSGKKVTGVFALADVMAIGAISAISDAGLSVPGDVSVIGYDGIPIGAYFCPKLSTVKQSIDRICDRSCEILVDCLENEGKARHEYIPFELDIRQSVRNI